MFGRHSVGPVAAIEFCDERSILFDAKAKMEVVVSATAVCFVRATMSASRGHGTI
jgi:hypothetical protein